MDEGAGGWGGVWRWVGGEEEIRQLLALRAPGAYIEKACTGSPRGLWFSSLIVKPFIKVIKSHHGHFTPEFYKAFSQHLSLLLFQITFCLGSLG